MNGVKFFNDNVYNQLNHKTFLYTLLCSNVSPKDVTEDAAYSFYPYSRLESYRIPKIDALLEELEDEGLIEEHEMGEEFVYKIGKWEGRKISLLINDTGHDLTAELNHFKKLWTAAVEVSTLHKNVVTKVSAFFNRGEAPKNTEGFVDLFLAYSQIFFMEEPRSAMSKEYGQMKTLMKLYPPDKIVTMMFYYIKNSNNYGKKAPSIGGLLFHKDDIFSKLQTRKVESDEDLRF